jgi:hypothetical protein
VTAALGRTNSPYSISSETVGMILGAPNAGIQPPAQTAFNLHREEDS